MSRLALELLELTLWALDTLRLATYRAQNRLLNWMATR